MNLFKIFTLFGFLMNSIESISVNSIIMNKYKEFIQENNKDFSYSHFLTFKNNIEYIDSFHDDLYELEMNKFTDVNMLKNNLIRKRSPIIYENTFDKFNINVPNSVIGLRKMLLQKLKIKVNVVLVMHLVLRVVWKVFMR